MAANDENPRWVLNQNCVDAIIENVVTTEPYTLSINQLGNEDLVKSLLQIDVLQLHGDKLGMNVPFFLEKDVKSLKMLSGKVANDIFSILSGCQNSIKDIIGHIDNGFHSELNIYHLLCAYIFDGLMFDFLEQNNLVETTNIHKSGLDYLVVLYEDNAELDKYSNQLLCSYNCLIVNEHGFVSFGDSNGNRNDFYRYYCQKDLNQLPKKQIDISTYSKEDLIDNFEKLVSGEYVEEQFIQIYDHFGYCKDGKIIVPVYDGIAFQQAKVLYEFILDKIKNPLVDTLNLISKTDLSAISHGINSKCVANEIYHIIFGEVNEMIVNSGLAANPPYYEGEGRYLKSFERK